MIQAHPTCVMWQNNGGCAGAYIKPYDQLIQIVFIFIVSSHELIFFMFRARIITWIMVTVEHVLD